MTELAPEVLGPFTEADKMLDYVLSAALTAGIELPPRQLITAGQAVYDCEQVSVTMSVVITGLPASAVPGGTSIGACPPVWSEIVEIAIVRCCPVPFDNGSPPTPEALTAHAQIQGGDTHILMAVGDLRAAERFGNVTATISYPPPSGGVAATVGRFTVALTT